MMKSISPCFIIYFLFYNAVTISDLASNDRMIGEHWIRKDLEAIDGDLIEVLLRHFPRGIKKTTKS
jgi:hypothetical protein